MTRSVTGNRGFQNITDKRSWHAWRMGSLSPLSIGWPPTILLVRQLADISKVTVQAHLLPIYHCEANRPSTNLRSAASCPSVSAMDLILMVKAEASRVIDPACSLPRKSFLISRSVRTARSWCLHAGGDPLAQPLPQPAASALRCCACSRSYVQSQIASDHLGNTSVESFPVLSR